VRGEPHCLTSSRYGNDYWQHANEEVLLIAMIETCEAAVRNLDALMALAYPEFRDELTIAVKTMHLI
jgi:2-keto-3-deoxy-L-rhamnonate aldolase RhmA